ncbi:hypothetical protein GCM10010149_37400 [Nonomuraea roseoviolacea subsp. roseoviolacea]
MRHWLARDEPIAGTLKALAYETEAVVPRRTRAHSEQMSHTRMRTLLVIHWALPSLTAIVAWLLFDANALVVAADEGRRGLGDHRHVPVSAPAHPRLPDLRRHRPGRGDGGTGTDRRARTETRVLSDQVGRGPHSLRFFPQPRRYSLDHTGVFR